MKIDLDDVTLFYRIEGSGDPALVMHGGLGADHTPFVNSGFNKLSRRLELVYYDHRCNGRSSFPGIETLTHNNLAADAENLRVALGHKNLTVIGHSYGGITALEYALRYPENLRRLILITTTPSGDTLREARKIAEIRAPQLMSTVDKMLSGQCANDNEFVELLTTLAPLYFKDFHLFEEEFAEAAKDMVPNAAAFEHSFSKLLPNYDLRKKLSNINVPVLILCGRHDWITPVSQSLILQEGLPNSELVIFENSGHWVYIEEEELFLNTVNEWLDRT
ncbi:MAG: proline iminopeptidase [Paracoccaceae bacterium]|jgi:proline iminopeptidase